MATITLEELKASPIGEKYDFREPGDVCGKPTISIWSDRNNVFFYQDQIDRIDMLKRSVDIRIKNNTVTLYDSGDISIVIHG